jgi:hypothetical protein
VIPNDLLADLGRGRAMAVRKVDQMGVGGVCEIQMPLGFQLAVKAVRGPHCIRSTESILDR